MSLSSLDSFSLTKSLSVASIVSTHRRSSSSGADVQSVQEPAVKGEKGAARRNNLESFRQRAERYAQRNGKTLDQTTVMVRNIPCQYTQDMLVEEFLKADIKINFLYLPRKKTMKGNVGYAFVNFVDEAEASRFIEEYEGYQFKQFTNSTKRATVNLAELQGYKSNVKFYTKRAQRSNIKFWTA